MGQGVTFTLGLWVTATFGCCNRSPPGHHPAVSVRSFAACSTVLSTLRAKAQAFILLSCEPHLFCVYIRCRQVATQFRQTLPLSQCRVPLKQELSQGRAC